MFKFLAAQTVIANDFKVDILPIISSELVLVGFVVSFVLYKESIAWPVAAGGLFIFISLLIMGFASRDKDTDHFSERLNT